MRRIRIKSGVQFFYIFFLDEDIVYSFALNISNFVVFSIWYVICMLVVVFRVHLELRIIRGLNQSGTLYRPRYRSS